VSVASDWDSAGEQTESRFGPISILVNNAGILAPGVSIAESDPADWDHVIAANLKGTYLGTRAVVASLKRAGGGSIVNIASSPATLGRRWSLPTRRAGVASED
jgi:3alpha(or 20beta)-hydroxysteroid dehydrogenase